MDEKTADLRDLFVEATGEETVTESGGPERGSLTDGPTDVEERLADVVATMRERYDFATDLDDGALVSLARGFHDGATDADLAAELGVAEDAVYVARTDLHLVRPADLDAPFDLGALRDLVAEGADDAACGAALGVEASTVRRYRRALAAEAAATRAGDRFRARFADLLTDRDLSTRLAASAREDGLREATEDIETDVWL